MVTDLMGEMVESAKGQRGIVRAAFIVPGSGPDYRPELHLWIEDRTDYTDPKVMAEKGGELTRISALGTRVVTR